MKKILNRAAAVILTLTVLAGLTACDGAALGTIAAGESTGVPVSAGSGVVINEAVSSNQYCLTDSQGLTPDWIELYNAGDTAVDLTGYGLSDNAREPYRFTFPATRLESGSYLVVLADGGEVTESTAELRADFSLAKEGESLLLTDADGNKVQELAIPELKEDVSWGRNDAGEYVYFGIPSPGTYNQGPSGDTMEFDYSATGNSVIKINEVMPSNQYSIMDADGDRPDWIEITNVGSEAVDLQGYGLGTGTERMSWRFPQVTLNPGEYLLVFCSGKNRNDPAGELHTGFKLSSDADQINLCDAGGAIIDGVSWEQTIPGNVSYGRDPSDVTKWLYFPTSTPGKANTTKGFEEIDKAMGIDTTGLWISEVSATGEARSGDPDWVEIANGSDSTVALDGYGLTDDKDQPALYSLDGKSVPAHGYLVVELKDSDSLAISSAGDEILLTDPDGSAVDVFSTGVLKPGITSGRKAGDETGQRYFFKTPTPGEANDGSSVLGYTAAPSFSVPGGYISGDTQVEISAEPGAAIYYTTDGSAPTASSQRYSTAITISKSASLRAIACEEGKIDSEITTATYLNEAKHDIPVVCISTAPDNLFSESTGIFANGPGYTEDFPHVGANYWKDWEKPINFEFYEADGTLGVEFPAGIRVFGQYSRSEDQKSVSIHLRGAYGQSEVTYPFFRDYDVTTFSDLLLRTSGQDWVHTKFRDAFFAQAVKDTMDLEYMEYRPVAVYINGRYWGLYNLREKVNESYLEHHFGVHGDNVDIIKGNKNALAGSADDFLALRTYMKSHNLSDQSAYDYVASVLDVDNFMDYAIVETYFNNTDTGNIKFWREKTDTGKWRMVLFDMDWGMFPSTYKWNMIEEFFNPNGHGVGDNFYSHIQCGLLQNSAWKEKLLERYAWHINNTFQPDRLNALVDQMAGEIRSEMPRQIERWGKPSSVDSWESQVEQLKEMISEKPAITIQDIQDTFGLSDAKMKELFPDD